LHKTAKFSEPGTDKIVREHGRRNFELRRDGKLCVITPIADESDVSGVGIFATDLEETKRIYDEDPGVKAGILSTKFIRRAVFPEILFQSELDSSGSKF